MMKRMGNMKRFAVSYCTFGEFSQIMGIVNASSQLEAVISFLKPIEGFEEWNWSSFSSLRELNDELSQCDISVGVIEIEDIK